MSNGRLGGHGIEVLSHDEGTFLVQSRTNREDYYMVEFISKWGESGKYHTGEVTCTCPSYQFRKECFHIKYICKLLGIKTPQATDNNQQLERAA